MTTHWFANPLLLTNVIAWTAQIGVLVAIDGALAALTSAGRRRSSYFWQGKPPIALLLPAIEPWARPVVDVSTSVSIATSAPVIATVPHPSGHTWKNEYVLFIILAGAALRALWIMLGFTLRLRRHRYERGVA